MPELTPQQLDEYRTNRAIADALDRQMRFDRPLLVVKAKPRKSRSDKVVLEAAKQPLTTTIPEPTVAA